MGNVMRTNHNESEQSKKHQQGRTQEDTLVRVPALQSNIPPRASAHPSAIATVRPKYPRGLDDLERVTHLDVTRLPTLPQRRGSGSSLPTNTYPNPTDPTLSGVSQWRTNDPITEDNVRDIEDIIAIDEIDTLPPNVQARLRPKLKSAAYDPSTLSDMDTWAISSIQAKPLAATQLPIGVGQITRPQGGSTWHSVDKVRWWLLSPGRLEFVLCLIGVIFLICVTSFFLLAIALSLGLFGSRG